LAQYDPIVIKGGFPTILGTDTCRADLTAKAGLTTAAVVDGDACQISAALTMQKALNTEDSAVVGVYDGTSGSIVKDGVVVANMAPGVVLANGDVVYLSATAGALTNVKPTTDMLHEVGVVVDAATSKVLLQTKPVVVRPTLMLMMDARSESLILPTKYEMPLPTTDAELVAQGWPSIVGAVDGDLWLCDEAAGNLVGEINGYQLAPQNAPLQDRSFQGLPYGGNLWAKKAVEGTAANQRFEAAAAAPCDIGVQDFTVSILGRWREVQPGGLISYYMSKWHAAPGWSLHSQGGFVELYMEDAVGSGSMVSLIANADLWDSALHLLTVAVSRAGNVSFYFDGWATNSVPAAHPGSLSNATNFSLVGREWAMHGPAMQAAWAYVQIGTAASRVGHDALWARLSSNNLGTANTYTRTNPLTYPIAASRVATAAASMLPVGFNANFVAGTDNTEQLGVPCEDGISFEGIGSDDFYTNATAAAGAAKSSVDGPSAMRDGVRVTMAGPYNPLGGRVYFPPLGVAIVGVSNVPWRFDINYRRALVNTTGNTSIQFAGDAGGPEAFAVITSVATPVDWTRGGGATTPVGAGHNATYLGCGAANAADDCDFGEPAVVKNRSTVPLAWRRVGTAAAASTSTPVLSYTNVGNARYSPAKGKLLVRVAGFQNPASGGELLVLCGGGGAPGGLMFDRSGGNVRLRMWDDAGVWWVDVLSTPIAINTQYNFILTWNAALGTASIMDGATLMGSASPGPWTPEAADVTPITVGSAGAGTAARAHIALVEFLDY
jgi:hypothetical protein